MADILLTCNADEFDTALNLVENIQDQLGIYDVTLYVEDDGYDEKFDAQIEESTVLLVFKFGESSISAWVTIKGINMEDSNYEQSPFPESIDFSCVDKGIGIFENILYEDFGLNLAQQETHIPLPYAEMELHWDKIKHEKEHYQRFQNSCFPPGFTERRSWAFWRVVSLSQVKHSKKKRYCNCGNGSPRICFQATPLMSVLVVVW